MSSLVASFISMEASLPFKTETARGEDGCITILPLALAAASARWPHQFNVKVDSYNTPRLQNPDEASQRNRCTRAASAAERHNEARHHITLVGSVQCRMSHRAYGSVGFQPRSKPTRFVFALSPIVPEDSYLYRARCASICSWANRGSPNASG
jgi:hypothetical protein